MQSIFSFIMRCRISTLLLAAANLMLVIKLVNPAVVYMGGRATEAMGSRRKSKSIYQRCSLLARKSLIKYKKGASISGLYRNAAEKMRKSGYTGKNAVVTYLMLKYAAIPVLFIIALSINFPYILPAFAVSASLYLIIEAVLTSNRRKITLKLQKYMYKIYKYLNNQISSGVRVTDAIKTVYEVIDDKKLRGILIRLAAFYELTLDIDKALDEFRLNFDAHEAETLCVVLKQGIETGDNQELLARQEDIMFKKYFNYIQAETDSCKNRCLISAVMYTAIVVLMIIIPLLNDTTEAIGKIFIN